MPPDNDFQQSTAPRRDIGQRMMLQNGAAAMRARAVDLERRAQAFLDEAKTLRVDADKMEAIANAA